MADNANTNNTPQTPAPDGFSGKLADEKALEGFVKETSGKLQTNIGGHAHELASLQTAHDLVAEHAKTLEGDAKTGAEAHLKGLQEKITTKKKLLGEGDKIAEAVLGDTHGTIQKELQAITKEHNAPLARGAVHQAMGNAIEEINKAGMTDAGKAAVTKHLDTYAGSIKEDSIKAAYEKNLKAATGEHFGKARTAITGLAETEKAAEGVVGKFTNMVRRDMNVASNAWSYGVDGAGAKMAGAKMRVVGGTAALGGGIIFGAKDMYVGIVGRENPETGEKEGASIGRVAFGALEMGAGAALAKMAVGGFGRV